MPVNNKKKTDQQQNDQLWWKTTEFLELSDRISSLHNKKFLLCLLKNKQKQQRFLSFIAISVEIETNQFSWRHDHFELINSMFAWLLHNTHTPMYVCWLKNHFLCIGCCLFGWWKCHWNPWYHISCDARYQSKHAEKSFLCIQK